VSGLGWGALKYGGHICSSSQQALRPGLSPHLLVVAWRGGPAEVRWVAGRRCWDAERLLRPMRPREAGARRRAKGETCLIGVGPGGPDAAAAVRWEMRAADDGDDEDDEDDGIFECGVGGDDYDGDYEQECNEADDDDGYDGDGGEFVYGGAGGTTEKAGGWPPAVEAAAKANEAGAWALTAEAGGSSTSAAGDDDGDDDNEYDYECDGDGGAAEAGGDRLPAWPQQRLGALGGGLRRPRPAGLQPGQSVSTPPRPTGP
jgi:hypothetical protein